jgi:Ion channel
MSEDSPRQPSNEASLFRVTYSGVAYNAAEFVIIIVIWYAMQEMIRHDKIQNSILTLVVLVVAWAKTLFFGVENLQQLWRASTENMAYHRFMALMFVNMLQIVLSFGLDYHCLYTVNAGSFSSISTAYSQPELVFEFVYFSALNFTFFGYGDVTPQTVPAKLLTITEILLAFITVIFLLSDFISMKDSLRTGPKRSN